MRIVVVGATTFVGEPMRFSRHGRHTVRESENGVRPVLPFQPSRAIA
jgi:hypothetical protein